MTMPKRIQRRRVKGWRMPEGTVYVGRPTIYGNPFPVSVWGQKEAVEVYRKWWDGRGWINHQLLYADEMSLLMGAILCPPYPLRDKHLACWCPLPKPGEPDLCHAAVLLEIANRDWAEYWKAQYLALEKVREK